MATVPKYDGQGVGLAVGPNVQVNTNAPIEAFGGGRAVADVDAGRQVLDQFSKIAEKAQSDADDQVFTEYASKLKRARMELEMDPKKGLLNRRGKDAFDLERESAESWEKVSGDILGEVPNERVRGRLAKARLAEGDSMFERVQSHVSREIRAHDQETTKALVETTVNDAIMNKADPMQVDTNLKIAKDTISKFAAREGKDAAWVERMVSETTSKAHATMINQYLDSGDHKSAQLHFERFKDQVTDQDTLGAVEKNLAEGSRLAEVTRISDEITMKTNDISTAMSMLKQIEDPKTRKEAQSMVLQNMEIKRRADDDRSQRQMDGFLKQLETSRGVYNLPVTALSSMKTQHIKVFEERKEQLLSGKDAPPNGPTFYTLRTNAAMPETRDAFLKEYLPAYATKMPPNELAKLIEIQSDLRSGSGKSDKMLGQFRSQNEIINSVLAMNKIDTSPKPGSADAAMVERMRTKVEEDSVAYAQQTGKAPSNAEIQRFAEQYMIKMTTDKGWFWDTEKRRIEMAPDEQGFVKFKNIPKHEINAAESSLRKSGRPVTPQAVEKLYNDYITRNGK